MYTRQFNTLFADATKPETPSNPAEYSIIFETKNVLDRLKAQGEKMAHEREYEAPSYGSSDESDRMYYATHLASVNINTLNLSEQLFFAVSEIINGVIIDGKILGDTSESPIKIDVRQGVNELVIRAEYESQYRLSAIYSNKTLPAPIGQVSFEKMKMAIDEWVRFVFEIPTSTSPKLIRFYPNLNLMLTESGYFLGIEKACKELDSHFKLNIIADFDRHSISLDTDALNKAKHLLFSPIKLGNNENTQFKLTT